MKIRKHQLTTDQRNLVVDLHRNKLSFREMEIQTGISRSTIESVVKKFKKFGSVVDLPGRGRKRKTSKTDDRAILLAVKSDRKISAVQVARRLRESANVNITAQTVRNRLHESNFNSRIARKKPFLHKRHIDARLKFAQAHISKPISFWKKILWSDESKFNLQSSDGPTKVWRQTGEAYRLSCMRGTVKFGGGNVMVWGSMAANGVGRLEFIDTTMNAQLYCQILDDHLFQSADKLSMPPDFIFQQDNDPKHTAKLTKAYFEENGVQVLDWPAQSPDLNPIEHLWEMLENKIGDRRLKSKDQLKAALTTAWGQLDAQHIRNLVESMPRRLAAVIKAKGGPTKY